MSAIEHSIMSDVSILYQKMNVSSFILPNLVFIILRPDIALHSARLECVFYLLSTRLSIIISPTCFVSCRTHVSTLKSLQPYPTDIILHFTIFSVMNPFSEYFSAICRSSGIMLPPVCGLITRHQFVSTAN